MTCLTPIYDFLNGHPERWTKGASARDKDGKRLRGVEGLSAQDHAIYLTRNDERAYSFDLGGLIYRFYLTLEERQEARKRIAQFVPLHERLAFSAWNDAPERKFEEVLELCLKAKV